MKNDIREKLRLELNKKINEEAQVVYILSRIRKIIEIDNKKEQYKKLKFYCDWSLHSQIDNTDPMKDVLEEFITMGPLDKHDFLGFKPFDDEFKSFLNEYEMTTTIYRSSEDLIKFRKLLVQIYSDTPLIIKTLKKTKITIREQMIGDYFGIDCKIIPEA